jgi:hypothetical protein
VERPSALKLTSLYPGVDIDKKPKEHEDRTRAMGIPALTLTSLGSTVVMPM